MTPGSSVEYKVRRMRAEDVEQVMAMAESLLDVPQWPRSAYLAALERTSTLRRVALVAANGSFKEVLGFAVASLLPPQAELETIAVRSGAQRQGIGSLLLDELTGELRAAAVSEVLLEVRASNHPAREFYSARGWRQTGLRPRYYADPEEDAILMSLALG